MTDEVVTLIHQAAERLTLERAAYALAMRLLQSDLVLDDEEQAAIAYVLDAELGEGK